jgi:amino acid adenylation domain-containing protein
VFFIRRKAAASEDRSVPICDSHGDRIVRQENNHMSTQMTSTEHIRPVYPYTPFPDEELEQSIPERFEKQVRACRDRLAIVTEEGSLTYRGLNDIANRLARTIRALRGDRVEAIALMFEHRAGVLAAMLGVLKTGKFYLVLDPSYPSDRLAYMLSDSGADLVITDTKNHPIATQMAGGTATIVNLDHLDDALSTENLGLHILPDALAMLLYTSGSTGQPKGVMQSHRNVLVEVRNLTNAWGISQHDRWLLYTSMSFANSVRTIYGAFLNGSAIFPYDLKEHGFDDLPRWLLSNRITLMRSLPTTFRNFMATLPPEQTFPDMRVLAVGGEPMPRSDLDYLNRHFQPPCVLVHGLGPTECFMVCWHYFPHGSEVDTPKLPIGYPLPGKDVLLLDDNGHEVPAGEIGEICVKSPYISPGYWRDPERTKAKFRPDPSRSGAQIYRTGDLGVRAETGSLTHVGRFDFQLKIRGFRIEVAEIEAALRTLPTVVDAVVVGRPDATGDLRLVAYFVPAPDTRVTVTHMRKHLAQSLPDYMIPAVFVAVGEIPKTPNGKVDRINLPPVSGERPSLETPFAAPDTELTKELAHIWADVLGVTEVGVHDDFFELGGDSLRAARIISRVTRSLKLPLPMTALFDAPTVAGMARFVEHTRAAPSPDDVAPPPHEREEMTERSARSPHDAPEADAELARHRAALGRHQRASFIALLRHAWRHSRFYRDLYSGIGIKERDLDEVRPEHLPTVDRKVLMEHFDDVVTDPRLTRDVLARWVEDVADPELDYLDAFVVCTSSGSSGTRGIFACSRRGWQLEASAMASRLPEPANAGDGKTRAAFYVVSGGNFSAVSGAVRMPQSIYERCIVSVLDSEDTVVDRLNAFDPHQLYGYSGSVHELAGLALAGKLRIAPKRIFVGGDTLTLAMERRIIQAWGAPVYEFYSASESKFIAYRQSGQAEMRVIDELNLLEVLDDGHRPVTTDGTGRAVLTNLYNTTLPLIRYELGDVLECGPGTPDSPLKTIKSIAGRVIEALPVALSDGRRGRIEGHALSAFHVLGLARVQFVSERLDRVRIVYAGSEHLDEAIRMRFQELLERNGAAATTFEVQRATAIPADPRTGKHRLVVVEN